MRVSSQNVYYRTLFKPLKMLGDGTTYSGELTGITSLLGSTHIPSSHWQSMLLQSIAASPHRSQDTAIRPAEPHVTMSLWQILKDK